MNKKIIIALIMVLVAVCGVSTYFHIKGRIESEENQKMYETVAEEVSATEDSTVVSASEATVNPYTEYTDGGTGNSNTQDYTDTMTFADNPDMVGWIKIDGTNINYPVMQTQTSLTIIWTEIFTKISPFTAALMFRRIAMSKPRLTM